MSFSCRVVLLALFVSRVPTASLRADDLWQAIDKDDVAEVKKLLAADPKLAQQVDKTGSTPLHAAARGQSTEIVKLLLGARADVNARANDNHTPLLVAATREITELLLTRGAEVNAATKRERFTALHGAARYGDPALVSLLLARGANPDGGWTGKDLLPSITPLHFAVREGMVDAARELLAKGATVDAYQFGSTGTVLYEAAERKNLAMVRLLLRKGADPNHGPALATALRTGQLEMIQLFAEKGADFKKPDLLFFAAESGKKAVVELALARGADVNQADSYGMTTLWFTARDGRADLVALLLDKGANPNLAHNDGTTPLHNAASKEIAERLLQHGARIDVANKAGLTPLAAAVYRGDKTVAMLLDSKGAKHTRDTLAALGRDAELRELLKTQPLARLKDSEVYPPLHLAARFGQVKTAQVLLDHGADVNAARLVPELSFRATTRVSRETALHLAAQNGHLAMVELLIEAGAKVNDELTDILRSVNAATPLLLAFDGGHVDVVKRLAKANGLPRIDGPKNAAALLPRVVKNRQSAMLKLLLEEGAPLDTKLPENDATVLHLAAELGDLELVKWLVGKKVNVNALDRHGWTPMLRAIEHGHLGIVEYLLTCGADVNIGLPLHAAAGGGHLTLVKLLVDKGAKLDALNDNPFHERTALGYAAEAGHLDVVKLLHARGASLKKDKGLLHVAAYHGKREIVAFLLDQGIGVEEFLPDGYWPYSWWIQPRQELTLLAFFAEKDPTRFTGLKPGVTIAEINGKKPFAVVGGRPLQAAVAGRRHAVASLLLDKGASPKVLFPDGSSLLHLAATLGDVQMVELLLTRGADANARDPQRRTPLQLAAERDEVEIVALLRKHGGKD